MNMTTPVLDSRTADIPDRRYFLQTLLEHAVHAQEHNQKLALLLIRLDRFEYINAIYGYESANILVYEIFCRIKAMLRAEDYLAHTGEGEFGLLIPNVLNAGHVLLAINKIQRDLGKYVDINGDELSLKVTIGASLFPEQASSPSSLMQQADLALITAIETEQRHTIFTEKLMQNVASEWGMADEIENGYYNDEFFLCYQPKIELKNGLPYGVEALMRWRSPSRGLVPPDQFIPVAEESGHINEMTWWALNTALREAQAWPVELWGNLSIAVNVSAKMLHHPEFVDSVLSAVSIWGNANALTIEVTESALMLDQERSFKALGQLKDAGIHISIDDFGTGYSSLSYFRDIPADELKIDMSFVKNMLANQTDAHIVNTVIDMAHRFGLLVVAEGIENQQTYNALREVECDFGQGYLMGKPLRHEELIAWINNHDPLQFSH